MIDFLKRVGMTKTAITATGTIMATLGAILTERVTLTEALPILIPAVLAITLRDAVAKGR